MKISMCILSWKCPKTLVNTLNSYKTMGLLDYVDEKIIYYQEISQHDKDIAKKFDLKYYGTDENIGSSAAMHFLAKHATNDLVLFLENDWLLIEDLNKDTSLLDLSKKLLTEKKLDVVRLRHRKLPGHPFWAGAYVKDHEDEYLSHLLWSVCWLKNPAVMFPDKITQINDSPDLYMTTSRYADFTCNPCIYRRDWLCNMLNENCQYADINPLLYEQAVQEWWKEQSFAIAQGNGLFTHCELDSPYGSIIDKCIFFKWIRRRSMVAEQIIDRIEKSIYYYFK